MNSLRTYVPDQAGTYHLIQRVIILNNQPACVTDPEAIQPTYLHLR
jgi:hypothetical protein